MMRIELVTDTFTPDVNGMAQTLGRLVDGLRELGHQVDVLHTAKSNRLEDGGNLPSVVLPGYQEVRAGQSGRARLMERWQRQPPDAVYVATESLLGYSAVKAAGALGIPVAAGIHRTVERCFARYELDDLKPAAQAYLKMVHSCADATFAPSVEVMKQLRREGYENVQLLGCGVDTQRFRPDRRDAGLRSDWGARPGTPVAMFVGRVAAEKNLRLAMDSFQRMRSAVPDVRCIVVGDGPLRSKLEREYPSVHFAGMRTGDDLARYYASADVLLFPSETETFGNVLLEAMASGLLTVSFDYAASGHLVKHGVNGFKVDLGRRDGFVDEALSALTHRGSAGIRAEARRSVEPHDWEQVAAAFEGRLRSLRLKHVSAAGSVY